MKQEEEIKINWKKVFSFDIKKDWKPILFFLFLMYMVWAYKADMEKCNDVIENLHTYCEQSGCIYPFQENIIPTLEGKYILPEIEIGNS